VEAQLLSAPQIHELWSHNEDKILVYERANLIFAINLHPTESRADYRIPIKDTQSVSYEVILDSDQPQYGGHHRIDSTVTHHSLPDGSTQALSLYLPSRTAIILRKIN